MSDFLLNGVGARRTFPFTFEEEQNLCIRIQVKNTELIGVGTITAQDVLRVIITTYGNNDKIIHTTSDLVVSADLTLTSFFTVNTPGVIGSGVSVNLNGHCFNVIAKRVEVTLISALTGAQVAGTVDVVKGQATWQTESRLFTTALEAVSGVFAAGVDVMNFTHFINVEMFSTDIGDGASPPYKVLQLGYPAIPLVMTRSNDGKNHKIHPNCLGLRMANILGVGSEAYGQVTFWMFK